MKIELVDDFTDFFDDIWVCRCGEKQDCYLYALNERGLTPIEHNPTIADSYNFIHTILLMPKNQCRWVLRQSLGPEKCRIYMDEIAKLMLICESINWKREPERTIDNPLRLSDLLGHMP